MSSVKKEETTKRNYDKEAKLQIEILEQKLREDYLTDFSQSENLATPNFGDVKQIQRRPETETKTCIPSDAKVILENWMYEHRLYCYPTKMEKQVLSYQTGLSVQKISNWFINSRRRILPKVLQKEGKSADNFTISRKKKEPAAETTLVAKYFAAFNDATSLVDYASQEEEKLIDQSSIFYGNDVKYERTFSWPGYGSEQQVVSPFTEPYAENLKLSYQAMAKEIQQDEGEEDNEQQTSKSNSGQAAIEDLQAFTPSSTFVSRGILYDDKTKSKCIYIVINSPS